MIAKLHVLAPGNRQMARIANHTYGRVIKTGLSGGSQGGVTFQDFYGFKYFSFNGYLMSVLNDIIGDGIFFPQDVLVSGICLSAGVAPSGSTITVQLTKDGVANSSTAVSLTAGNKYGSGWTEFTAIAFTSTNRLGFKLSAADSGLTAQSPIIGLRFRYD